MAIEKTQQPQAAPKGQFFQIFLFMAAIFVLFNNNLRNGLGNLVGFVLNPVIGFNGQLPALTILLASVLMVGLSTFVRHHFMDWVKIARIQNVMRSYQKAMREARSKRDMRRLEQIQKAQPKVMKLQSELSATQMKPMGFTFLIIIPLFAWLSQFIVGLEYPFFSSPWNPTIDMFGATVLPHWILFYTAISIPFGALVQKALKAFEWRDRWHLSKNTQEMIEMPGPEAK